MPKQLVAGARATIAVSHQQAWIANRQAVTALLNTVATAVSGRTVLVLMATATALAEVVQAVLVTRLVWVIRVRTTVRIHQVHAAEIRGIVEDVGLPV